MTFLALDVGNTRLKWGLYDSPAPGATLLGHGAVFLENIDRLADEDWRALPEPTHMLGCIVAGEAIRRRVEEQMELWDISPHWAVSSAAEAGMTNGYDHPTRLGADRWVAMIGAHARMLQQVNGGAPKPMVVVMVGTAVTVEAIDASGRFLGGLILPGHGIMLRALESGTAGLRVPTGDVCEFPTNTSDALMSGGTYGIAGAIERMHRHLVQRCGELPVLLMSGGAAVKLAPETDLPFELTDTLVFEGLLQLAAAGPFQGG